MAGLFFFSYLNFELIFCLQYWILSLKIQAYIQNKNLSVIKRGNQISMLFWSLEFVIVATCITSVTGVYVGLNDYIIVIQSVGALGIAVICLGLIADAFRRLSKSLQHDKFGISKYQFCIHVSSYCASIVALLVSFLSLFINWDWQQKRLTKLEVI